MIDLPKPTPAERRYRMPAEWARHAGTWLSWPHNADTWPGAQLRDAEAAMAEVVRLLAPGEDVHVNVQDAAHREHVARVIGAVAPPERLVWHVVPTDDAWIRDHGAIFVRRSGADPLLALDFEFNAWGGKYPPYDRDRAVAGAMAAALGVPSYAPGIVLEGGSIDVDGAGLLLTTEQCLLNRNRNPELGRDEIEAVLRGALGADRVLWLGAGIEGDDTDGHIDDLTRFVGPGRVVTVVEDDSSDPNAPALRANRERLAELEQDPSLRLEVVELPMPPPLLVADGQRLPASYANFYVANAVVLVPAFSTPTDDAAAAILADCVPGRRIERVDCRALVAGFGAVHCLTQQLPDPVAAETRAP